MSKPGEVVFSERHKRYALRYVGGENDGRLMQWDDYAWCCINIPHRALAEEVTSGVVLFVSKEWVEIAIEFMILHDQYMQDMQRVISEKIIATV